MASLRATCTPPSQETASLPTGPRNRLEYHFPRDNVVDPTSGSSLFTLLAQGRRHALDTSSSRTGMEESTPSTQRSMSTLPNYDDEDNIPKLQDYESRQEWICALIDASLDMPAFDEDDSNTNGEVGREHESQ